MNPVGIPEKSQDLVEGVDFIYVSLQNGDFMRVDAKENDPEFKEILDKAFHEADQNLKVYTLWHWDVAALKKKILKEKYGITWRSIYELNPKMIFD